MLYTSCLRMFRYLFLLLPALAGAQAVPPAMFQQRLGQTPNAQLLDVRTPAEFAEGHLPDARNLNWTDSTLARSVASLDKSKPVFVYCLAGGRSAKAAELLRAQGFSVYDLDGGYMKWSAKMLPVAGVARSTKAATWTPARLDSLLRSQDVVLVDVYAPWCPPCRKMAPTLDKLSAELAESGAAFIIKTNADTDKDVLKRYVVEELPTLLLFRRGQLVKRATGYHDEAALRALLQ